MTDSPHDTPPGRGRFQTTRWSLVLSAGTADAAGKRALADLCGIYWYPLYAYLRRRGEAPGDAADLTQGFFARLLEREDLAGIEAGGGRFRSYLLKGLQNFTINEWHKQRAGKRGGDVAHLPLDLDPDDAESRYKLEPADDTTPEKLFERRWALAVLEQALQILATEMSDRGRGALYDCLKPYLEGDGTGPPYAEVAARFSMTEGAVKVAVHRLRARFGELLRLEVGHTLRDAGQADAEVAELLAALAG